jgi:hypothetical protein
MNTSISSSTSIRAQRHSIATSKTLFFIAAFISFALSIWLWFSGDRERGLFVGLWVPSILSAGTLLLTGGRRD